MAFCPAYSGAICSLCCSLDARCHDSCKPRARISNQVAELLPQPLRHALARPLGRYVSMLTLCVVVLGGILVVIYSQTIISGGPDDPAMMGRAFLQAAPILIPVAAVLAWLLVLGQQSRRVAQEETGRQTTLLMDEIRAHKRTDRQLQKAKEVAEAANLAKSRFVVGISHELRSPLNAILGYAQLLERDTAISALRRDHIRIIRRSGEHLAGLIEGLLDVSKIEAGRIELYRDEVRLQEFLQQLVNMFSLQAEAKGIGFSFVRPDRMPAVVYTDERRLRQILINLLSNAIKFTSKGEVRFRVRWRGEIAEFEIADTGIGIAQADLSRIFEPFERVEGARAPLTPGIGLGLTITRLLTQIMGGELTVTSELNKGSQFRVRLMLSEASQPLKPAPLETRVLGYKGERLTVLIADDDPVHRGLLEDLLSPLGFIVFKAADGDECLAVAASCQPDVLLVDIAMPGPSGWEVARRLRASGFDRLVIIVISANPLELRRPPHAELCHNDVLAKPVNIADLLNKLSFLLQLEWLAQGPEPEIEPSVRIASTLDAEQTEELRQLGAIGYIRGIQARLDSIEQNARPGDEYVAQLRRLVSEFQLDAFMEALGPEANGE
jgi:signal transduction histidine kinase/FixJ family two-component response regulator